MTSPRGAGFQRDVLGQQEILVPVSQLFNPVKYAWSVFAADRTYAVIFPGLGGTEADGISVAVKADICLLRKEFNGAFGPSPSVWRRRGPYRTWECQTGWPPAQLGGEWASELR